MEEGGLGSGRLDLEALGEDGIVRWADAPNSIEKISVSPGFQLGVKWPTFWQYLGLLEETRFLVCVRHPFEVVASYKRKGGRLGLGLDYEVKFNRKMNAELSKATGDPARRRVLFCEYVMERMLPHVGGTNVLVVHYERWFGDSRGLLSDLSSFLGREIEGPNTEIRRSLPPDNLSAHEIRLIRQICKSAEAFGYEL